MSYNPANVNDSSSQAVLLGRATIDYSELEGSTSYNKHADVWSVPLTHTFECTLGKLSYDDEYAHFSLLANRLLATEGGTNESLVKAARNGGRSVVEIQLNGRIFRARGERIYRKKVV